MWSCGSTVRSARPLPKPIVLLLWLLALAMVSPVAAQQGTLDLAGYERLLREARAAAARGDRISLEAVAPQLSSASVTLPDGSSLTVDNRWLTAELARRDPRLPWIAARLGALIDALAFSGPAPPDDARERLERILAGPPFAQPAPRPPGFIERLLTWLTELIERIATPLGRVAGGPPGTLAGWALIAAGAALVVAVLVLWLRGLQRALRPAPALPPPVAERHSASSAREQAEALARAGNYREAVRLLALAALLWLDERGRLRYQPHQTNREHLARLGDQPGLRARLAPVVETADHVWYGGATLDAAAYAAYARQVGELREEAGDAS